MQGTLGKLEQAIHGLSEQVKDNDKKLDHISHVVYAVGAVVTVLGTIAGFILKAVWDVVEPILRTHLH